MHRRVMLVPERVLGRTEVQMKTHARAYWELEKQAHGETRDRKEKKLIAGDDVEYLSQKGCYKWCLF